MNSKSHQGELITLLSKMELEHQYLILFIKKNLFFISLYTFPFRYMSMPLFFGFLSNGIKKKSNFLHFKEVKIERAQKQ